MQKRSLETRTRILETALALFSHSGYDATGVAEICKKAQVSKGAFYHHFPSKQAIFLELLDAWLATIDAQMDRIQSEAIDVPQALVEMAGQMGLVFQAASNYLPMFLEFWVQAMRDPEVWDAVIAPYRRYQNFFESLIQQGIDEGSLHPYQPDQAARSLVSIAVGLLLQSALEPEKAAWDRVTQQSINIFLNGLAKDQYVKNQTKK